MKFHKAMLCLNGPICVFVLWTAIATHSHLCFFAAGVNFSIFLHFLIEEVL